VDWRGLKCNTSGFEKRKNIFTQIKITNLDGRQTIGEDAEYILRLEITVGDALLVQELQSLRQIAHHHRRLVLCKVDTPLNMRQERTTRNLFEDQIEAIFLFEELDQLDYVGMALAMVERFDFLEDTGAAMTRYFIDYLRS